MGVSTVIRLLDHVVGYMTGKSYLGLVLGYLGVVRSQVGEELVAVLLRILPDRNPPP